MGSNAQHIPYYADVALSAPERQLLREVYGVEDPRRLYLSDSTPSRVLKYDTKVKTCLTCYVYSYRIGFVSVRRPGESWEQVQRRVRAMPTRDFPPSVRIPTTDIDALDPEVQPLVQQMLADAAAAGFHLRVIATYRSPRREAFLMALGRGRTYTLTSSHSYGRAIDVLVDDGRPSHAATRAHWIAFRRWVVAYHDHEFHILGTPDRTWDWTHVGIPRPDVGFRSIDEALANACACTRPAARGTTPPPCNFPPHLPALDSAAAP